VLQSGIEIELRAGERVAVTGPSGSGKTTLLRTIVGLQDPAGGGVLLEGRDAASWGWPVFRRNVVLVAQQPALFEATVEENLKRPFTYRASTGMFPRQRALDLLDELGVGADRIGQEARTLSVGQKQRVSLIRAMLLDPMVVCLDEPTSALDPDASARVQQLITREAAGRGLAALIVTHSREQAEEWCDRQIVLPGPGGAPETASPPLQAGAPSDGRAST
jgi:putative ABC transport system ATP-binding protein